MMKHIKKALSMLLVLCMVLSFVPVGVSAEGEAAVASLTMGTRPADGTTTGNPFPKGTGGSNSFRIPAMVTLSDGTLVAAADARWNTTYDGGGLDTIVSYSTDNGAKWNYTFANYLGDNGNEYNGSGSTAFIDPALATDGSTVYMLCDLYPYGVALNGSGNTAPSTAVGFNSDGTLKLAASGSSAYNYYLKDGQIYDSSNNVVSGYTVDAYFNITGTDGTSSNLFFSDSPYQVVRTGYLYLTKSTDGGKTWSEPTLIPNVKTSSEQVCLVGPGRGLVTDGKIIFPVYSYNGSSDSQRMGFIYSTNSGATWTRVDSSISWSSESAVVELEDGTLRFFYRNGTSKLYYADYTWETGWGSAVNTGIATNSNTQISAISYSKTVDGKQVILVSCPTGSNGNGSADSSASARLNGKIFVGYVNSDKTMDWQSDKAVSVTSNNSQFMYSCLTELSDGKVSILYENQESAWGTGDNCYYTMDFQTYNLDLASSGDSGDTGTDVTDTKEVTLTVGENKSYEVSVSTISTKPNETIATAEIVANSTNTYQNVSEITSGKWYLMAVNTNCVLTTMSTSNSWGINGFQTASQTVTNGIISANLSSYLWQITQTTDGYTIRNADGQYLAIDEDNPDVKSWGTNYPLKVQDEAYIFAIDLTTGAVGNTTLGAYLNNYGDSNTCVAGYKGNSGTSYSKISFYEAQPEYSMLITGVSAGTTSVTVGGTLYNITVNRKTETVNVSVDGTATYEDSSTGAPVVKDSSVATATLSNGTLTIKGVAEGTTTVTTDTTVYTVTVSEGTAMSIEVDESKTISVSLGAGQYVEWTTSNNAKDGSNGYYLGVAGKYDATTNAYTDTAILVGYNVTAADSPVVVSGTVYNADGTVAGTYKWLVTVTESTKQGSGTGTRTVKITVGTIENCTVYYSINGGALIPVNGTGVLIDKTIYAPELFNIMFFAAPDEGYALTYMAATGTQDQYYTLSNGDNPDGTDSDAWPFNDANPSTIPSSGGDSAWKSGHGFRWALIQGNMSIDQMKVLFSNALALGCDGATTVTMNNTDNGSSKDTTFSFVAQKLPTVEKTIKSITHDGKETTYTDGMKVEIGDTIKYSVVVTRYATNATYGTITYDKEELTDELTNNDGISNPDMGTSTTSDQTYTYTTSLTLTTGNFSDVVKDGKITNTVDFSYSYSSQYSAGTLHSKASAVAEITVEIPSYVIDFGLPVKLDLTDIATVYSGITGVSANYGAVALNNSIVTYTPNQTLKGVDYITLELGNGGTLQVAIYPATTVYYEEGFASYEGNWSGGSKGTGTQATQVAGSSSNEYGYDVKYFNESNGASNGTQATSSTKGDKATFNFTGTGVDIYTNSTPESGKLTIQVKNGDSTVKLLQVDTSLKTGNTDATAGQNVTGYNVPVASISGLTHGSYTVSIIHTDTAIVNLDGFRVYGTLADQGNAVYTADLEDNPTFIELRDQVLAGLSVTSDDSGQVNAALPKDDPVTVAVVGSSANYSQDQINDLLNNGPKNEIYLQKNQSLVFKITTNREVQIGLKALDGNTSYTVSGSDFDSEVDSDNNLIPKDLTSSTDMFYTVLNRVNSDTDTRTATITITNNGPGILSITKLKVCDDPNATLCELTEDDLTQALVDLGLIEAEEPETPDPEDPEESEQPGEPDPEPEEPEQPSEPDPEPEKPQKPQNPNKPQKPQNSKPGKPISSGGNKGNRGGRFMR